MHKNYRTVKPRDGPARTRKLNEQAVGGPVGGNMEFATTTSVHSLELRGLARRAMFDIDREQPKTAAAFDRRAFVSKPKAHQQNAIHPWPDLMERNSF